MKTLANAATALSLIAESQTPVPVARIAARLGIPRSSASRLMASLRDGGLVEQEPTTRHYGPGALAWQLGTRYRPTGYDMDMLSQAMGTLSQLTGFTCWLSVLDRREIVLLRQHQGRTPALFSLRLGQRLPAHATAVGKALLARLSDQAALDILEDQLEQETPQTISSPSMLLAELANARERGYAVARQEAFPGVVAIAGSVYGAGCNCPLGLSVSFPIQLGNVGEVTRLLTENLHRIGQDLGDPFWMAR